MANKNNVTVKCKCCGEEFNFLYEIDGYCVECLYDLLDKEAEELDESETDVEGLLRVIQGN